MSRFIETIQRKSFAVVRPFVTSLAIRIINRFYGGGQTFINMMRTEAGKSQFKDALLQEYLFRRCSYIGDCTKIGKNLTLPHGLASIFISRSARIGDNVVIFHNVTIGSNTTKGSKGFGAPVIGNNVFIGAGAIIIGNVKIDDNARIGAGAIVVKDVPANAVVVPENSRIILKDGVPDNRFVENSGRLFN